MDSYYRSGNMIVISPVAAALAVTVMASALAVAFVVTYSWSPYHKALTSMQHADKLANLVSANAIFGPMGQWRVFLEAALLILFWNMLGGGIMMASQCSAQLWSKLKGIERFLRLGTVQLSMPRKLINFSAILGILLAVYSQLRAEVKQRVQKVLHLGASKKDKEVSGSARKTFITDADFEDLKRRIQVKSQVSEKEWNKLSEKSSSYLSSEGWEKSNKVDPLRGCKSSSLQLLVKTVFEGVSFEDVTQFWLDDDFRKNWDRCFVSSEPLLTCEDDKEAKDHSCEELMRWIRKFPAFCSAREYIIARKTFVDESTKTAYVITKAVETDMPAQIRRVTEYYSSWRIRLVPSQQKPGEHAVETMLLHYEDLGLPNAILKLAVRTFFGWFVGGLETQGLREYVNMKAENRKGGSQNSKQKSKPKHRGPTRIVQMLTGLAISLAFTQLRSRR